MSLKKRYSKPITLVAIIAMFLAMVPYMGNPAFAAEDHGDFPVGGIWEPQITIEKAPEISDPEIEKATRNGEYFSLDEAKHEAGKKSFRSGSKSSETSAAQKLANTIYDSPNAAVADVRKALVEGAENERVDLTICIDLDYWDSRDFSSVDVWNSWLGSKVWENYNKDGMAILNKASSYTGKATEGDYIAYRYWGFLIGSGIPRDGTHAPDGSGREFMQWKHTIIMMTSSSQEEYVSDRVEAVIKDLDLGCKNDFEKVKSIYGWVSTEVKYDYENMNVQDYKPQYTAYAALKDGKAVCQGYATLLYRMLQEAGIECRVVSGDGHGWNAVKMGDHWYYVDSTWDAGYAEAEWNYFLKGRRDFDEVDPQNPHTPENISGYDFTYDATNGSSDLTHIDFRYADDAWFDKYPIPGTKYLPGNLETYTHKWGSPTYTWTPDNSKVTAVRICTSNSSHREEETVNTKSNITRNPTCTVNGEKVYTAAFKNTAFAGLTKKETLVASGHKWDAGVVSRKPTSTQDGIRTFTCTICKTTSTESIPRVVVNDRMQNPLSVKAKVVKLKAKNLKKKKQIIGRTKAINLAASEGSISYTKVKVNSKKYNGKFTINSSTGKITVKKGVRKGTYKMTIRVSTSGNERFLPGSKTITVTIKVR